MPAEKRQILAYCMRLKDKLLNTGFAAWSAMRSSRKARSVSAYALVLSFIAFGAAGVAPAPDVSNLPVTITVEDATLEWVRIEAARRNTSVSRLVGEMLTEKMQHDDAYARAQRDWVADTSSFSSGGKAYPLRDLNNG